MAGERQSFASELDAAPATSLARGLLFLFAAGIPIDVILASRFGSSSLILGVPLALAAAWQLARRPSFRSLSPTMLFLAAFTAWAAVSVLWSHHVVAFELRTKTNVQLLVSVLLGWQILRSRRDVRAAVAGFVLGCSVAAVETWRVFGARAGEGVTRFRAESFDPNDMAVTLALGIPMAAYLAVGGRLRQQVWLGYVPLAVTAIVFSGSRGGTLTAITAVAAVTLWLAIQHRLALVGAMAGLAAGIALASAYVPPETWGRIFTAREELAGGTLGARTVIWQAGLDVLERNVLVGVGAGGFPQAVAPALFVAVVAHNTLLSVAVELGIVGVLLLGGAFAAMLRGAAGADKHDRALATILVLAWWVGSSSLTWDYRKTTWFVILIGAAVAALRSAPALADDPVASSEARDAQAAATALPLGS
jgi:O-antigen ligase